MWGHRHIRVTALCAIALNLFFSAFYLIILLPHHHRARPRSGSALGADRHHGGDARRGRAPGRLLGALVTSRLSQVVSPYVSIIAVFWVLAALTPVAAFVDSGYVLGLLLAAMALLPPTANTTIITRQLLLTPDELRGRLSSVLAIVTGVAGALGPVLGGLLAAAVSGTLAVLVSAGGIAAVAVVATVSPTLRNFPRHRVIPAERPEVEPELKIEGHGGP